MTSIYSLIDPRTGEIRYVGKANNPTLRLRRHLRQDVVRHNNHRTHWLTQLQKEGLEPILRILEQVPSENWQFHEKKWIAKCRAEGCHLTNSTDGGDGLHNPSNETRKKISHNSRNRSQDTLRKIGDHTRKLWSNPDYRQHMSACAKNISESTRDKMRLAAKSRSKESIEKRAEKLRGKKHTQEHKIKISEGGKRSFTPERRLAVSERNRNAVISKGTKRKHSEYKKSYWANLGKNLSDSDIAEIHRIGKSMTQVEIGKKYSISQSSVSRILRKALTTMEFE